MSRKRRRRRRPRKSAKPRRQTGGVQIVTPEGDAVTFTSARYQHGALEEIRRILEQADDFGIDDALEPEPDGSLQFPWHETRPGIRSLFKPFGKRVLADLTLTLATLEVEAMSQRRLDDCCERLEELLGDRIQLVETRADGMDEIRRKRKSRTRPQEPATPSPKEIAEIEDKMLRQWINEPTPALDGLTPKEAAKSPDGRRQLLEMIEEAEELQKAMPKTPGMFLFNYRKVRKMLGLE